MLPSPERKAPVRPTPSWLITDEVDYVELDLGNLKSGKEAEVFVVERTYLDRSCLLGINGRDHLLLGWRERCRCLSGEESERAERNQES